MPKENNKVNINKHEIDIETLKKQNVNDLLSIKELYRRIEELEKKITQIKYIDSTLANKLKKEYEKLKRIILDENLQIKLTNDIETINSQLDTNTNRLGLIKSIIEYSHLKQGDDWTLAIQRAVDDIASQKVIKVVFPYGTYRITNSILLGSNYMLNFEGEHGGFNADSLPSKTLASTIYLDVEDNDIPMFTSIDDSKAQIGGQISNMGFMSYKNNY